jgi:hypothetical protein
MTARNLGRARRSFLLALIGIAACGRGLSSAAQNQDQATASLGLKKELEPLAYFAGHWTCKGVFPASGKQIASDIVARVGVDGAWLVLGHDDAPPNRFHAMELWGFDPSRKQFVAYIFDNFGGARKFTSPGWADTQWIWSGEPGTSDPANGERFVFTRGSDRELTVSYEVKRGSTGWTIGDQLTCQR